LHIPDAFQQPFHVSHESVAALRVHMDQPIHDRVINLRRIFSALVTANVKEGGVRQIKEHGPFEIHGDPRLMNPMDELITQFIAEKRMKLSGEYKPVYRIVSPASA